MHAHSGELGLRKFLEDRGHTYVVTTDKDGEVRTDDEHDSYMFTCVDSSFLIFVIPTPSP
jgi:formate dehydrogenase